MHKLTPSLTYIQLECCCKYCVNSASHFLVIYGVTNSLNTHTHTHTALQIVWHSVCNVCVDMCISVCMVLFSLSLSLSLSLMLRGVRIGVRKLFQGYITLLCRSWRIVIQRVPVFTLYTRLFWYNNMR